MALGAVEILLLLLPLALLAGIGFAVLTLVRRFQAGDRSDDDRH